MSHGCSAPPENAELRRADEAPPGSGIEDFRSEQYLRWIQGGREYEVDLIAAVLSGEGVLGGDGVSVPMQEECRFRQWRDDHPADDPTTYVPGSNCSDAISVNNGVANACSAIQCTTNKMTCEVSLWLEIADATQVITFGEWLPEDQQLHFPPQSVATQAALREKAVAGPTLVTGLLSIFGPYSGLGYDPHSLALSEADCLWPFTDSDDDGVLEFADSDNDGEPDWSDEDDCVLVGGDCADTEAPASTRAEALVASLNELQELAREATDGAVSNYVAVADSRTGSLNVAGTGELSLPERLRLHALAFLIGGVNGVNLGFVVSDQGPDDGEVMPPAVPQVGITGFCDAAPLDEPSLAARRLIEQAAPSLESVRDDSEAEFETALRTRLGLIWGQSDLTMNLSDAEFLAEYGVSSTHVLRARGGIIRDADAFLRDPSVVLDREVPAAGGGSPQPMYAATAGRPHAPPPAVYAVRSQGLQSAEARFIARLLQPSRLTALEAFKYFARNVQVAAQSWGPAAGPIVSAAQRSVAGVEVEAEGYLVVQAPGAELSELFVSVIEGEFDSEDADLSAGRVVAAHRGRQLILVRGASGIACATLGTLEGERCRLADYVVSSPAASDEAAFRVADEHWLLPAFTMDPPTAKDLFLRSLYSSLHQGMAFTEFAVPAPSVDWTAIEDAMTTSGEAGARAALAEAAEAMTSELHVLALRAGASPMQPGSYEHFASAMVSPLAGGNTRITAAPAVFTRAGRLVTPDPANCQQPAQSCAAVDTLFDARLPLEDELTDNGDAYENSWQRYLDLADQAAREADLLGEEAIGVQFDIDSRTEAALSGLEDLCGVPVDLEPIRAAFEAAPANGVAGALEVAAATSPELRALQACLGIDATSPAVALGADPLCVWFPIPTGDPVRDLGRPTGMNYLCEWVDAAEDAPASNTCPRVQLAGSGGCSAPAPGYQSRLIDGDDLLALFAAPVEPTQITADQALCNDVRTLGILGRRLGTQWLASGNAAQAEATVEEFRAVHERVFVRNRFFGPGNLQEPASRIRWEAEPTNYSTVFVDERALASTGRFGSRAPVFCGLDSRMTSTRLVCPTVAAVPADQQSVLCALRRSGCTQPATRRDLNARMAAAATMARWLGGVSFEGFRVPSTATLPNDAQLAQSTQLSDDLFLSFAAADGAFTHYCTDDSNPESSQRLWDWGLHQPTENTCPHTIRFERLEGERAYGGRGVDASVAQQNAVAAAALLRDLTEPATQGLLAAIGAGSSQGLTNADVVYGGLPTGGVYIYPPDVARAGSRISWLEGTTNMGNYNQFVHNSALYSNSSLYQFAFGNDFSVSSGVFFDALELLCEAGQEESARLDPEISVNSSDDFASIEIALNRQAAALRRLGSVVVFRDVPVSVRDAMRDVRSRALAPPVAGAFGTEVLTTRAALIELSRLPGQLADELEGIANDIRIARNAIKRTNLTQSLQDLQFRQTTVNQLTACVQAMASSSISKPQSFAGAGQVCANSVVQIAFAARQRNLEQQVQDTVQDDSLATLEERANGRSARIRELTASLEGQINTFNAALNQIRSIRARGEGTLARALFLDSDDTGRLYATNTTLRRRNAVVAERYRRARENAIRMAFLAKRAVEQRFGVRLSELGEDMTLVRAPASWEGSLCESTGINPETLRDADADFDASRFADQYIGDYVRKLRSFVESYRLDYPILSGADTAVISLRDDIHRVRAMCVQPTGALLSYSAQLDVAAREGQPGWDAAGCIEGPTGAPVLGNCVRVSTLDDVPRYAEGDPIPMNPVVNAIGLQDSTLGDPSPYRVTFGPECASGCDYQDGVTWGQDVFGGLAPVAPVPHRISWFGRAVLGGPDPSTAVWATGIESGVVYQPLGAVQYAEASNGWRHYWYAFSPTSEALRVEVGGATAAGQAVDIGGVMLEEVAQGQPVTGSEPRFIATAADSGRAFPLCEDTDGVVFRRQEWRRECELLCDTGFTGDCPASARTEYCYWMTEFPITQHAIDRGELFAASGFARGNFNYRVDTIAINFVGSASRVCENSATPSTCYNAGWIPYSLEHIGPFPVRNTFGGTYDAPLFNGRIEHARGLAAERYLTNPIGGDEALIRQYTQYQFRGRPLTGTYRLRVWEEPGVNFEGIDDVQILLGYRYWTRAN